MKSTSEMTQAFLRGWLLILLLQRMARTTPLFSILTVLALLVVLPDVGRAADPDLVAFYPFNGNANDESGNGNNGFVLLGATLTADRFGNPNSAFAFVGPSNPPIFGTGGIQVPDNGSSLDITGDFSIALWLRATGEDGWVLNKHATNINNDGSWTLSLSSGRLYFGATGHFDSSIASGPIPISAWAFVVLTYSRTTGLWTFYINGAPNTSGAVGLTIADTSLPFLIGIHADNFLPFPGDLDDIRIYKRVLTDAEVLDLLAPPVVVVAIDIKPGSFPNSINLGSVGVVPVAILSTTTFDATQVDPSSVTLAGARVKLIGKADKDSCNAQDVNGDGLPDLVCHVVTAQFMIEPGDSVAVLEAQMFTGRAIRGEDSINIVP